MQIEISDDLAEQYTLLLARRSVPQDLSQEVERLIKFELRKFCAPGYETDGLTGCRTRHQLELDINRATWKGNRQNETLYRNRYLCLDIDNFKHYLDMHGLTAGDAILLTIATQLRDLYPGQNIYRFGGDDFVAELGDTLYIPLAPIPDVTMKHSLVEVIVERDWERLHHINGAIVFHLDKGIVEASTHGTKITFNYPKLKRSVWNAWGSRV